MKEPKLSLFQIERQLVALVDALNDCEERIANDGITQELTDERDAISSEIGQYLEREVKKVDGVASYIRHHEAQAALDEAEAVIADQEAERLRARAARRSMKAERVSQMALTIMQAMDIKKLEGAKFTLSRRQNPPRVHVSEESLLPKAFFRVIPEQRVPDKNAIKFALKPQKCAVCNGFGFVDHGEPDTGTNCPACNGQKTLAGVVPGARLVIGEERLEIK